MGLTTFLVLAVLAYLLIAGIVARRHLSWYIGLTWGLAVGVWLLTKVVLFWERRRL